MISIDGETFDTGQLFHYDLLQTVLEKLSKLNRGLQDKVDELKTQNQIKDKKIEDLENKLTTFSNNNEKRFKGIEITINKITENLKKKSHPEKKDEKKEDIDYDEIKKEVDKAYEDEKRKEEERKEKQKQIEEAKAAEERRIQEEEKRKRVEEENARMAEMLKQKELELQRLKEEREKGAKVTKEAEKKNEEKEEQKTEVKEEQTTEVKEEQAPQKEETTQSPEKSKEEPQEKKEELPKKDEEEPKKEEESSTHQQIQKPSSYENTPKKSKERKIVDENGNEIAVNHQSNAKESTELLMILFKRVSKAEKKVEELSKQLQSYNKLPAEIDENRINIKSADGTISELRNEFDAFIEKYNENSKLMEDVRVKMTDFSIYDMFKDTGDGNMDAAKALIMNLENKVFQKFGFVDERVKTLQEDVTKQKTSVKNIENVVDGVNRATARHKEIVEKCEKDVNELKSKHEDDLNELENRLTEILANSDKGLNADQINEILNPRLKELEIGLEQKLKELIDEMKINALASANPEISKEDLQLLQEFNKRINDLEKKTRLQMTSENLSEIRASIDKIEEQLNTELPKKLTKVDLNELNTKFNKVDDLAKDNAFKVETLIEKYDRLTGEYTQLINKIELLSGRTVEFSSNQNESSNNRPPVDLTKFVDLSKFNENNKYVLKQIDQVRLEEEELRRKLEDILLQLKHSPNDKDFKDYQGTISNLFEEQKLLNNKRYADKIDTHKTFKYLETQIKQIVDVYKSKENSESWLLAKKPLSNYQCASCESNLKDLTAKYEYLPWNKYPVREDKAYRMGHGFSRMLQMVNMDILKSAEASRAQNEILSDDEEKNRPRSGSGRPKLPAVRLTKQRLQTQTQSVESREPQSQNLSGLYSSPKGSPNEPKVVKVFKMNRHLRLGSEDQSLNDKE